MDVTFFEGQSYYTDSYLQWESNSEDLFLNCSDLTIVFVQDNVLSKNSSQKHYSQNREKVFKVSEVEIPNAGKQNALDTEVNGLPSIMSLHDQSRETTEMCA